MAECDCLDKPDAVEKKDWICIHGNNLKKAHEERQKKSADAYKNQLKHEAEARVAATAAYNKVFADTMEGTDQ